MDLKKFEKMDSFSVIRWALEEFKDKVTLASSFNVEDIIIIDIMVKEAEALGMEKEKLRIFTIDTGRLHEETYKVIEKVISKYGIKIDFYFPDYRDVEEMERKYGPNLFYKSIELRKLCCNVRKVKVLKRALNGFKAWITGLRREQSVTRKDIKKIEIDEINNGIFKINPLVDWHDVDIWNYVRENRVPYNELHDRGYSSIGCAPCTRAIKKIEDFRAGRWWWESPESKECGLHVEEE